MKKRSKIQHGIKTLFNKSIHYFGFQPLMRIQRAPKKYMKEYNDNAMYLKKEIKKFDVFKEFRYEIGTHHMSYVDYECEFVATHLYQLKPKKILDIGSYRHFILGLLAHYPITTIDIRGRNSELPNETVITCDAKKLAFPDNTFDVITSLCTLEHFGLCRYGDELDTEADKKAFNEMIRVLKPNGHLLFSTTITRSKPAIIYNVHRIYNYDMIHNFCSDLICEDEKYFSRSTGSHCTFEDVTTEPKLWDVYCGCWKKKK